MRTNFKINVNDCEKHLIKFNNALDKLRIKIAGLEGEIPYTRLFLARKNKKLNIYLEKKKLYEEAIEQIIKLKEKGV